MTEAPLIVRYRPEEFDQLVGHDEVIKPLMRAMSSDSHPHAYLLHGIRGVGKTTTARIIARYHNCEINEAIGSVQSGVDDMRDLVEGAKYIGMGGSGKRMFLVDECHRLSRNAFDALLKILEEPPSHLYITLCTTDYDKVPDTIKSRCYQVLLQPLRRNDMLDLLDAVAGLEGWKVSNDVLAEVASLAHGSARDALTMLQAVHDAPSRAEMQRIIGLQQDDRDAVKELLRLLLRDDHPPWKQVMLKLQKIEERDFEEAAILGARYIAGAIQLANNEEAAFRAWRILDALVAPSTSFDRKVVFIRAIGKLLWEQPQ